MMRLSRAESTDIQRQMKRAIYCRDNGMPDPKHAMLRKEVAMDKKQAAKKEKFDATKLSNHDPNLELPKGTMVTFYKKGLPKKSKKVKA